MHIGVHHSRAQRGSPALEQVGLGVVGVVVDGRRHCCDLRSALVQAHGRSERPTLMRAQHMGGAHSVLLGLILIYFKKDSYLARFLAYRG